MKLRLIKIMFIGILIAEFCMSCKKDWLDAKPDKALFIPKTLSDYKSLISGTTAGGAFNVDFGSSIEHGSADFYVSDTRYNQGSISEQRFYSWAPDLWGEPNYSPWTIPYQKIFYTNIVLEGIETITPTNSIEQLDWNQIKGGALFFRAIWHFDIAKQFCMPYKKNTAGTDLGIPLRLTADFNDKSIRSTVEQTYTQIIDDLKQSSQILPIATPISDAYKCLPTKTSAYAMLARIYLSMSQYDSALVYADKTLQLDNALLDYSNVPNTTTPFQRFNQEVIYHMTGSLYVFFLTNRLVVDSTLYKSYDDNDLRKQLFFRTTTSAPPGVLNAMSIKSTYDASFLLFMGPTTAEMYLTRAECHARANNKQAALSDLNTLMVKRWKTNGTWAPFTAIDAVDALAKILVERRKELCFRGLRWTDLRRLNMESQFAVTLKKTILGQPYTLPPNSPLYVYPIPPNVIQLTGMPQNPR